MRDSPYKTVADVIAAAKAQPGALGVATPGYGSINQLVLESIALNTGTKFVHVPYKGGAPAAQALVAGDIPLGSLGELDGGAARASGHIRVLAVTRPSVRRSIRNGRHCRRRAPATSMLRIGPRFSLPRARRSRSSTNSMPKSSRSSTCPT